MGEIQMETEATESPQTAGQCSNCVRAAEETAENEEISLAFLLALVPVISLTFFGQIGLL